MYGYIRGKITEIDSRYVILENNDIGYIIYVPNPYSYKLDGVYTIFTYSNIKEDEYTLFGFKEREEKELFLKLISVKGLGPRMALPIMATGTIDGIADAIENRVSFRIAQKQAVRKVMRNGAYGIKTSVSGRLGGTDIARTEGYLEGNVPLSTLRADIDYVLELARTTYGVIGVKV